MTLQQQILEEAKHYGICDKFRKILEGRELSVNELLDLYHRGHDFCIEHNFPSRDIVMQFRPEDTYAKGIYYDYDGHIDIRTPFLVVNGNSDVDIHIPLATTVCLKDDTMARITLDDGAFVHVDLYDNAQVEIVSKGKGAKAYLSLYHGVVVNENMFNEIHYKKEE